MTLFLKELKDEKITFVLFGAAWSGLSEKGSEGGQNIKIILFFFLKKKF